MVRFWCTLLLLLWYPALTRGMDTLSVSQCTYHQRNPHTIEGLPIFLEMWRQGCTTVTFLQYVEDTQVHFPSSPCATAHLNLWVSGTVPSRAQALAWYHQPSWGRWQQVNFRLQENEFWLGRGKGDAGVTGTTLWCGVGEQPAPWPDSQPSAQTPPGVHSSPLSSVSPTLRSLWDLYLPEFHLNYLHFIIVGCFLLGLAALGLFAGHGPDVPALREEIERLHIKKVESENWGHEWRIQEVSAMPEGSVDTTEILRQWRTKARAHTYRQLRRKAKAAAKHFGEDYTEVYDMLVNENEEDIKRWELIKEKERPPWGIFQVKKKK